MRLGINGSLEVSIFENGKGVTIKEKRVIIDKLNNGSLFIGLASREICDTNFKVLYTIEFSVMDDTEFEFKELEN